MCGKILVNWRLYHISSMTDYYGDYIQLLHVYENETQYLYQKISNTSRGYHYHDVI